jgi:hypothetical protein
MQPKNQVVQPLQNRNDKDKEREREHVNVVQTSASSNRLARAQGERVKYLKESNSFHCNYDYEEK